MPLLRFTNPTDIPAYDDWDFEVLAADFTLRTEDMRDVYTAYLETHRQYYGNIPKDSGRFEEAQRITELQAILIQACTEGRDIALDGNDYVWAFANGIMFEKRFVAAFCPACRQEFGPGACGVQEWSYGGGLAAQGDAE